MVKLLSSVQGYELFDGMSLEEANSMVECLDGHVISRDKGAAIFVEGSHANRFGIVLSGSLVVVKDGLDGKRIIIKRIGEKELVAAAQAFSGAKIMRVRVEADAPSRILILNAERVCSPCCNGCAFHARLVRNVMRIISAKTLELNAKIEELLQIVDFLPRLRSMGCKGGKTMKNAVKMMNAGKYLFAAAIAAMFAGRLAAECTDGVCMLPPTPGEAEFSVVSPVPEAAIEPMREAPRLKSLDGKTIALVGGSFMANVTHPELKRLILAEFPTAKVYVLSEIGSAGPWPRPGVVRREKDAFQRKLKEFKVDAVVSGNGGCGLCTPKETGSCIAAEALGLPSVMIAAPGFVKQAKSAAASAGLANLCVAEYPGAFASHTREELLENTRKILWPQVKAGLTGETDNTRQSATDSRVSNVDCAITGTFSEIQRVFLDSGWTDGLPIVPPTEAAVAEFLKFTDLAPDHSLGAIPPAQRAVTVRLVAANGVMAGCPPEYMPLLIAFVEAMKAGDFRRPLASTHAWTPYCWLNGPVARQLGFDCGQGEINEPKNAVLGRFLNLAMLNLGGYRVKENRMGTFGYLMPWCLVEDEAAARKVGWEPWHVQCGYSADDSTLTAASAINWGNNLVPATSDGARIKDMIAWDAVEKSQMAVASGMPCTYRVFLMTQGVARDLARTYPSKDALCRAVEETARIPLGARAFANYWGNPGSAFDPAKYSVGMHERRVARKEGAHETATPPWLAWTGIGRMDTVPAMEKGKSAFLVTGDPSRNKELCVPGGGFATVKIRLPKEWDKLMAERGYEPLENFSVKCKSGE